MPRYKRRLAFSNQSETLRAVMTASANPAPRLRSLDALRGFDMLWIIGLSELVHFLATATGYGWLGAFSAQLEHVTWEGLRPYDLIFPLFMFSSGISAVYALTPKIERGDPKRKLFFGIWRRALILVLLGIVYNGGLQLKGADQRFASVLGQIGLAYGIAATVFLFTRTWKTRAAWCAGIMVVIAALQLLFPVPGHGAGVLTQEGVVNAWLDRMLLPGRLHVTGIYDPEGLLCIVSASALTLGGVLVGAYVRSWEHPSHIAAGHLIMAGTALLFAGWICWHLGYPPIKNAWTSTFNLLAGGICTWVFAAFHLAVDFRPPSNWSFPLQVIGMNSITIYLMEKILPFPEISAFFLGGIASRSGKWEDVIITLGILAIEWLLLYFLWKKKAFLRV